MKKQFRTHNSEFRIATKSRNSAFRILNSAFLLLLVLMVSLVGMFSLTTFAAATDLTVEITGADGSTKSVTLKDADGDDYYDIGNADDLYAFAAAVNSGNGSIRGKLTDDIDLESRAWTPITNFSGTFDGAGYEIKNFAMNITAKGDHGLFGFVKDATIKNFTIYGEVESTVTAKPDDFKYGVIADAAGDTTITDVHSYVNFTIKDSYFRNFVGGILGRINNASADFAIERCSFSGTLNLGAAQVDCTGGIVAYVYADNIVKINNCLFDGEINSTYNSAMQVGGLLGYYRGSGLTVTNALSIGNISVSSNTKTGALVGILRQHSSANQKVTNNYYLEGDQPFGNSSDNDNITDGHGSQTVAGSATAVTDAQLKSGEVAYKLGSAWGQTIDTDEVPVLGGAKVYYGYLDCDENASPVYTNNANATEQPNHDYTDNNGFCKNCDAYEPAKYNETTGYYEIGNAGQLYWFAQQVNGGNASINGELTADIVVNKNVLDEDGRANVSSRNVRVWTPIGQPFNSNLDDSYGGTFDGKGHTVSGLYFNAEKSLYMGLFGYVRSGGTVQNVGVEDSYLRGENDIGGVAGYNGGTITNCYNAATVINFESGAAWLGTQFTAGGIAGNNSGTITNCNNTGIVTAYQQIGGVVGNNISGTITNCYYLTGTATGGINGADVAGQAEAKTAEQFASGEVAYLLQGEQESHVWGQTLDGEEKQAYPVLGGAKVYYGYLDCDENASPVYTNNANATEQPSHIGGTATCSAKAICTVCQSEYGEFDKTNHDETVSFDENGFCGNCDAYEPATLVDESNRADFGFTDETYDGYWAIGNLGQLMWFAESVANAKHSVILTADITIDNSVVWTPITPTDGSVGNSSIFNGGGHTITFANTNEDSTFGLFGQYNYSIIENLYLAGSIKCNTTDDVGVLVNYAYRTTIRNVISTCDITNDASSGGVGGLAGLFGGQNADGLYSLIENCAVYADISGGGSAGGLIGNIWGGYQYCTVRNCAYVGNVAGGTNSGAIVGHNGNNSSTTSTFSNIYFCETDGIGWIGSKGSGKTSLTDVEAKTAAQFASGEVAYLLGAPFGQTLEGENRQNYPVIGGATVPSLRFEIYGQQLNLGGDLSMKYYVSGYADGFDPDGLKMEFLLNGVVTTSTYEIVDGFYVFTLEGINPQCMGDSIYATLLYQEKEVANHGYDEKYSVEINLNNLLTKYSDDKALVTLVNDILAYGEAASAYKDHKTMTGKDYTNKGSNREIPEANVTLEAPFTGYTVRFGMMNYIRIGVTLTGGNKFYLNGEEFTYLVFDGMHTTAGIAPTDFATKYKFEVRESDGTTVVKALTLSVNDYAYVISQSSGNDNMKALAKALYNYGVSAETYNHVVNGVGEHTFTYTENKNGACVCGLTLNDAVAAKLAAGETDITITLPADAPAEMFTAIRRALIDTEGVEDGSINLTLKGVTAIPDHYEENPETVIFGMVIGDSGPERVIQLASISLPDVVTIGSKAFEKCEYLTSLYAPKVQTIGSYAFSGTALTSVELPQATTIGSVAFSSCTSLTTVKLPSATNIGNQVFLASTNITDLELTAEGAITLGKNVFGAPSLNFSTSVNLVLHANKESEITDGTTWNGYAFANIMYPCIDSTTNHTYGAAVNNGDGRTHSLTCTACEQTMIENCHGGEATCKERATCEVCGVQFGELSDHIIDPATGYCKFGCETWMAVVKVTAGDLTVYCSSLGDAANYMLDGATATLLQDVTSDYIGRQCPSFTLDLNGYNLSHGDYDLYASGDGKTVTLVNTGAARAKVGYVWVYQAGNFTFTVKENADVDTIDLTNNEATIDLSVADFTSCQLKVTNSGCNTSQFVLGDYAIYDEGGNVVTGELTNGATYTIKAAE